jgi:hypothetical protein
MQGALAFRPGQPGPLPAPDAPLIGWAEQPVGRAGRGSRLAQDVLASRVPRGGLANPGRSRGRVGVAYGGRTRNPGPAARRKRELRFA